MAAVDLTNVFCVLAGFFRDWREKGWGGFLLPYRWWVIFSCVWQSRFSLLTNLPHVVASLAVAWTRLPQHNENSFLLKNHRKTRSSCILKYVVVDSKCVYIYMKLYVSVINRWNWSTNHVEKKDNRRANWFLLGLPELVGLQKWSALSINWPALSMNWSAQSINWSALKMICRDNPWICWRLDYK
jgi:hypothetical protein